MDQETPVAASTTPDSNGSNEPTDERLAAFKRGAPVPKAAPAPKARTVPKTATTDEPRTAPKPKAATRERRERAPEDSAAARSDTTDPEAASSPVQRTREPQKQRPPRAPKPAADAIPAAGDAATTVTGDGDPAPVGQRKRRRRGGRGRGGRSGASAGAPPTEAAPEPATKDPATRQTQRDDALPDTERSQPEQGVRSGSSSSRRRRRGGRGGGGQRTKPVDGATETPDPTDAAAEDQARKRPKKAMTVEEQVAAGGPTRGIRSSRSRTGRTGRDGRRRREPTITPPRITDKVMVITERGDRDQIAVLEQDVLVQHYVTRTGATSMVGNVYLGRVQNVLPGMEAAFVDIGRGRNGVLYAGEVNYSPEDLEGSAPRIEQVLKAGQAVLVQITKDPMGGKGARLTAQISLPGRFLVFAPNQNLSGISRRLPDEERRKLKSILKKVKPPEHGVIVRTAAEGASEEAITHDLTRLIAQWDQIQSTSKKVKAPNVVYEESELTVRVVRDMFTDEEYRSLVTDSTRVYDKVMDYVNDVAPDLAPKVSLSDGPLPAFEEHRIEEQIHKALDRKVWLPSGGYLIIERTEAMTIIDVNTGKSVGKTNLEETVVNTNLEAAKEVARQLRLRDIGGIIVVDFIDMLLEKNKKQVEDTMKEALAIDKTRSQVFEIGPLGLMQVTRKRVSGGLVESFSETCPTCEGRGIIVNYEA
jgi:ribonuclease E